MKILLLEDDYSLNETIKETILTYGYEVDTFYNGLDAFENISYKYDLYILDINTPEIEGVDILTHIKNSNPKAHVFMISAIIDIEKIKECYNKGCDDYIKKPFNIDELIFKIERISKLSYKSTKILKNNLSFCLKNRELYIKDIPCTLTKNEKNFLFLLIKNSGKIISHEQIEDFVYSGKTKSSDAIRSLVKRIRKKIPVELIQNSLEEGYFIKI